MARTKQVTDAGIRKVMDAMGVTETIKGAGQGWTLKALQVAHACRFSTHSEALDLMNKQIVKVAGQSKGVVPAKDAKLQPYTQGGGLGSQFAAGKHTVKAGKKSLVGLHAYHPARFAIRARLTELGDDVVLGCEEHGIPTYKSKGEAKNGASYPDNKSCNNECKIGVLIGGKIAYDVLAKPARKVVRRKAKAKVEENTAPIVEAVAS